MLALALASTGGGACIFLAPFPDVAADPGAEGGGGGGESGVDTGTGADFGLGGGDGGGGEIAEICAPLAEAACYEGPLGTEGRGLCLAGVATCNADGTGMSACAGQVLPDYEDCETEADENCDGLGCAGEPVRGVALGGAGDQRGTAVAVGEDAVVVAGSASGSTDLGGGLTEELGHVGDPDAFVVSFTRDMRPRFSRRFADSVTRGVALAPDGDVVIVGGASGDVDFGGGELAGGPGKGEDVVVARFGADGAHRFSRRFGDGANQFATAVAVDTAGNAFVTGRFWGTLDLGTSCRGEPIVLSSEGESDAFLIKLDATGAVCLAMRYGDAEHHQAGTGVAIDSEGNLLLAGWFGGTIDFGGLELVTQARSDLFIAKLSAAGDHLWSKNAEASNAAEALGVAVDGADNVLVVGSFRSKVTFRERPLTTDDDKDILLVKLGSNGVARWSEQFGDGADQEGASVAVDLAGDVFVTGSFLGSIEVGDDVHTATGAADAFVARLDPDGGVRWWRSFGDSGEQRAAAVAVDRLGGSWVAGRFSGGVDLGSSALASEGTGDAFLAEIGP
ncbi:hypothetical protein SOCEGT47_058580 [Sorangium cellulosum]|uniref:Uncharacterized protein n=1 Tax=Sorangium cellulosum TaxID=56 RepID=A0A4P2Q727_SORCE|nr:hypothetical protein [Sorangium cellulosum]AUX25314.1 hypothetical protein SOCEGT47_058580 [Sorangium cellulosum]